MTVSATASGRGYASCSRCSRSELWEPPGTGPKDWKDIRDWDGIQIDLCPTCVASFEAWLVPRRLVPTEGTKVSATTEVKRLITNPRYVNYARAHRRTPDQQLKQDAADWPGDETFGYHTWNNERLLEFNRDYLMRGNSAGRDDHHLYDEWLTAWVDDATI